MLAGQGAVSRPGPLFPRSRRVSGVTGCASARVPPGPRAGRGRWLRFARAGQERRCCFAAAWWGCRCDRISEPAPLRSASLPQCLCFNRSTAMEDSSWSRLSLCSACVRNFYVWIYLHLKNDQTCRNALLPCTGIYTFSIKRSAVSSCSVCVGFGLLSMPVSALQS